MTGLAEIASPPQEGRSSLRDARHRHRLKSQCADIGGAAADAGRAAQWRRAGESEPAMARGLPFKPNAALRR